VTGDSFLRGSFRLRLRSGVLRLGERTLVMGVLNVTPDSFSDAESTRPGSEGISAAEELRRLLPVLEALPGKLKIPISVDTQKSAVAEIALGAGAQILNDVSGLRSDSALAKVAAKYNAPLILMHMRGSPRSMQKGPFARDVVKDVLSGLRKSIAIARKAGVARSQIVIDPGIGFGKSFQQNYELLAKLPALAKLGFPILVGTSRKGFLGATLARNGKPAPPDQRLWGTAATVAASVLNGAHIVRVHDVAEMVEVARATDCLVEQL
jgi:dihydropteroate synthase